MKEFFRCLTVLMMFYLMYGSYVITGKGFCESYGVVNKLTTNYKENICYINVNNKNVKLLHYLIMKKWDL